MGVRTRGRELAIKYLFGSDLLAEFDMTRFEELALDQEANPNAREFAKELLEGLFREREKLIPIIEAESKDWTWRRMPTIDRNILLLGCHEIVNRGDIPAQVTINELVELAKRFGSESSSKFVNGVLDTISKNSATNQKSES